MDDAEKKIPAEQQEKAARVLNEVADLPCPRCGNNKFGLVDQYVTIPLSPQPGRMVLGGNVVPAIGTYCLKCGFVALHALSPLGLKPEEGDGKKG